MSDDIEKLTELERVKAVAIVNVDNLIVIKGVKVMGGEWGFYVSPPSKRLPSGRYLNMIKFSDEIWREVQKKVLEKYYYLKKEGKAEEMKYEGDKLPGDSGI